MQHSKTPLIKIQETVPRPESLLHKISELSWIRGTSNFFIETVPFSFSNSPFHARQITHILLSFFYNQLKTEKSLTLLDLGSGTGLFIKQLLDYLYKYFPKYAKKIEVTISEQNKAFLDQIKKSPLFNPYTAQCHFEHLILLLDLPIQPD